MTYKSGQDETQINSVERWKGEKERKEKGRLKSVSLEVKGGQSLETKFKGLSGKRHGSATFPETSDVRADTK